MRLRNTKQLLKASNDNLLYPPHLEPKMKTEKTLVLSKWKEAHEADAAFAAACKAAGVSRWDKDALSHPEVAKAFEAKKAADASAMRSK